MVDLIENENFSNDLNVMYLDLLKQYDYSEEFDEQFAVTTPYIKKVVSESTDISLLKSVDDILEYKKNKDKKIDL